MSTKVLFLLFCVYYSYEYDSYESYKISNKNCENHSKTQKFIIGGSDATENEFPFMASIRVRGLLSHLCGATLISRGYALTAAHCLINQGKQNLSLLMGTNDLNNGYINDTNIYNTTLPPYYYATTPQPIRVQKQTLFDTNQIIINGCFHTRYDYSDDIALIRLTKPINQTDHRIETICLPPKDSQPIRDTDIIVVGWGTTGYNEENEQDKDERPRFLQKAKMELRSEEYCVFHASFRYMGIGSLTLTGDRLCLKSETSTACHGDSGGPAFQKFNEKWYQIGVASFGYKTFPNIFNKPKNLCYKSAPNVYTKTSSYIDWINHSIEKFWNSTEKIVETKC